MSEAAAVASLQDDDFIKMCRDHTTLWRGKLMDELKALGIHAYPSTCNFVLARFRSSDQADAVFRYLKERKITLRPMGGYGLADCLRITIGRDTEMNALFAALKEFEDFKHVHPANAGKQNAGS
jgi:histidinol-phosphate aminotransferase